MKKSTRRSRRLRNKQPDEKKGQPFFSKANDQSPVQAKGAFFQTKLTIGQPGDKYEQEADNMADAVTNKTSNKPGVQKKNISGIQRYMTNAKEDELGTNTQRMEKDKAIQEKPQVQRMGDEKEKPDTQTQAEEEVKEKPDVQCAADEKEKPDAQTQAEEEVKEKPDVQRAADEKEKPDAQTQAEEEVKEKPEVQRAADEKEKPDAQTQAEEEVKEKPEVQRAADEKEKPDAQTQAEEEVKEKPEVQRAEDKKEDKGGAVQTKAQPGKRTASPKLTGRINRSKGKGQPMPNKTRAKMESAFGVGFENVRIHTGQESVKMNKELKAQAFTHGKDVYFNQGKFSPESTTGQHLLAHELTHVVQQGGASIKRDVQNDKAGNPVNYRFSRGKDISAGFYNTAKKMVADGHLADADLRKLRMYALRRNGTVNANEKLFMAALLNPSNRALLAADKTGQVDFPLSSITKANRNYVDNLDRQALPPEVMKELQDALLALGVGDFDSVIDQLTKAETKAAEYFLKKSGSFKKQAAALVAYAKANGVSLVLTLAAAHAAASDGSNGDRVMAGTAFAVAKVAGHAMAEQLLSGALKVDALVPSAFRRIPGMTEQVAAAYVPVGLETGVKGDTLYLQTTLDVASAFSRSYIIHELTHAADDSASSKTGPVKKETANQLEANAYRAQARYFMDQVAGMSAKEKDAAIAQLLASGPKILAYALFREGLENKSKYEPILKDIGKAASPTSGEANVAKALSLGKANLDTLLINEINTGYGFSNKTKTQIDGLAGSSILDALNRGFQR